MKKELERAGESSGKRYDVEITRTMFRVPIYQQ